MGGLLVTLGIGVFLPLSHVSATSLLGGEEVTVEEGEVLDDDYIVWGGQVDIRGTIDGDLYVLGGVVRVSGDIERDLVVLGGQVDVTGRVDDDLRAVGGQVRLNGIVGDNVVVGGGSVEIGEDAQFGGDLLLGAGSALMRGHVMKRFIAGAGMLQLQGAVDGDVEIRADDISLNNDVVIGGHFQYFSPQEPRIAEGATIVGEIQSHLLDRQDGFRDRSVASLVRSHGLRALMLAVVGLVFVIAFPRKTLSIVRLVEEQPLQQFGYGLVIAVVAPVVAVLIGVTIIGLPLALMVIALYGILLYLSKVLLAFYLGKKVVAFFGMGGEGDEYLTKRVAWSVVVGSLIIGLIGFLTIIPTIGWIISFVVVTLGKLFFLGALFRYDVRLWKRMREKDIF
jgi:hypothetical protein